MDDVASRSSTRSPACRARARRHAQPHSIRRLGLRDVHRDGAVAGSWRLDPVAGAACKAALDDELMRLRRVDDDPANPGARARSHHPRLADAFADLVTRGVLRPDGTRLSDDLGIDPTDPRRRCELVDGAPLHPSQVVALLGRCGEPGCDAPPAWLEADHIIPWSRGGPTAAHNGQIRCAADNKARGNAHPTRPTGEPTGAA